MLQDKVCKDCGSKDLVSCKNGNGNIRLRSRCRLCWNKFCSKYRAEPGYKEKFNDYMKEYSKEYRKINKSYRERNNKHNKKAIVELKDSYVKNRLFKSKKSYPVSNELIEAQRELLKLKREIKNGSKR